MNFDSWTGIAGIGAVAAAATAGWSYIRTGLSWCADIFICRTTVVEEAGDAVLGYCWHRGRRSPFGMRVFGGAMSWVQPKARTQLVAYENISSDPVLVWFGRAPVIVRRRAGGDNSNTSSGSGRSDFESTIILTCVRGTINLDDLVLKAVEHFNHVRQGQNGESKRRRFFVRRMGHRHSDAPVPTNSYGGESAKLSPRAGDSGNLHDRLLQKTLRLLQWKPEDLVAITPNQSAFHGYAFPPEVMQAQNEMRLWLENEKWFRSKSVPWRRGWLLHGKPGTGKSTLVRAMAMQFDLPVFTIDLSTMDNESFVANWSEVSSSAPCVALIEDIDAVFNGRQNIAATNRNRDSLTFDCLLNCISGVGNSEGIFLVITTNHPETLDPALGVVERGQSSRPGRIDRVIELGYMGEPERRALANHILSDFPDTAELAIETGKGMTPAQFQDYCAQAALRLFWERKTS